MSDERAALLREWHERAYEGMKGGAAVSVEVYGFTLDVPAGVYPPHPLGLAEVVLTEVRDGDRVLDLGTGSGINALAAATRAHEVVAVDINPDAVACARQNAQRNSLADHIDVREGDLFDAAPEQFDRSSSILRSAGSSRGTCSKGRSRMRTTAR